MNIRVVLVGGGLQLYNRKNSSRSARFRVGFSVQQRETTWCFILFSRMSRGLPSMGKRTTKPLRKMIPGVGCRTERVQRIRIFPPGDRI